MRRFTLTIITLLTITLQAMAADLSFSYEKKYSTFLTQRQIQRVYEIERGMRKKLMQRRAAGKKGGARL